MGKKKSIYQKELTFLRNAVDVKESKDKHILRSPTTLDIIRILETFLKQGDFLCYGGMAVNNILPPSKQFYDKNNQLPDYDFFSKNAIGDAKRLADLYYKEGYENVEAKSGLHEGTYKVYVNFLQIADITQMESTLFKTLKQTRITIGEIHYAPPNFLRMSIYLELSRPDGDVSRWEKVYNRLQLLNKYRPLNADCRSTDTDIEKNTSIDQIYKSIQTVLIDYGVCFFGGYALNLYRKYDKRMKQQYTMDAFVDDLDSIRYELMNANPNLTIRTKSSQSKYMPDHLLVYHEGVLYARLFQTNACYSYNIHRLGKNKLKIATIYTILSMYLLFVYSKQTYFDESNLLCLCEYLLTIYKDNRLKNKGLLKNYSLSCYGNQATFESIILLRNQKFNELKHKKNSQEYETWFLRYNPSDTKKN
jgi:hypothetical protein